MPDAAPDAYTCTHCGHDQWMLRFTPDEAALTLARRAVVAVWCALCETPAPPDHPYWPAREDAPPRAGGARWTR